MAERWLNVQVVRPSAVIRLLCFPWGGGGSNVYATRWARLFEGSIEVCAVRLPGRETRQSEACYTEYEPLISDFCQSVVDTLRQKPFALWGHSMGALLAYETTKALQTHYGLTPMHLFLSGAAHPTPSNPPKKFFSELPDTEFLEAVKALGGTPKQVMEDEAMMQFFLPMLRGDFTLVDGLRKAMSAVIHPESVSCPITVFNGESDISRERMEAWQNCTDSEFCLHCLPGGHFYLFNKENEAIIVRQISKALGF